MALRPEKVRIASRGRPAGRGENCVAGQVWDIGYLGDLSIYKVRLDNGFVMKARCRQHDAPDRAADRRRRPGVAHLGACGAGVVLTR